MEFTDDPTVITRVWASFPLDAVFDSDDPRWDDSTDEWDGDAFEAGKANAYAILERAIAEEFPNATDIWTECTGWEGTWAQFSPRADNPETDIVYEHFYDWLDEVQGKMWVE